MRIVLTGCSGGGKSTLLEALAGRGHRVFAEPGRRVVREETAKGGSALPWTDGAAFAARCIALALDDLRAAGGLAGPVFFDRSWLDAAIWLEGRGLPVPEVGPGIGYDRAFLLPPWPEIRVVDAERRQGLAEAVAEYDALAAGYPRHGVPVAVMPKAPVAERIGWLADQLGLAL
jgi:predicted ATPase